MSVRRQNIAKTIASIELAYELGIPTMRVNTGRWGTSKSFDDLMKHRGIEPPLPGYTDADGFPWVIESLEKCLPTAEKCGVTLAARTIGGSDGCRRRAQDRRCGAFAVAGRAGRHGESSEEPYEKLTKLAPRTTFMQAKTYYGSGIYYTLDLDYKLIAAIFRKVNYRGYTAFVFEGHESPMTARPKNFAPLRSTFNVPA